MTLLDSAATGDRLQALVALRDRLAGDIDKCESSRDVAALSLRYVDVLEQISNLRADPAAAAATPLSDFQRRLAERQGKTA